MSDNLKKTIQDWSAAREASPESLRILSARISTETARRRSPPATTGSAALPPPLWPRFALAACASAVLALTAFIVCFRFAASDSKEINIASSLPAAITGEQAENGRKLFNELEYVFADQLRWAAYSNGKIKLGIEPIQGGADRDSAAFQYRLTVLSRKAGDKTWQPAWTKDVLLRSEEFVEVTSDSSERNSLSLWILPVPDGKVMVETGLSLDAPARIASRSSSLMDIGKPVELLSTRSEDTEYRVFQSVALLSINS